MGLFNRKKEIAPKEVHECVMKDFPWYMEVYYDGSNKTASYKLKIIEPYVCISGCGKRIDKVLESDSWSNISSEGREKKKKKKKRKEYSQIRQI